MLATITWFGLVFCRHGAVAVAHDHIGQILDCAVRSIDHVDSMSVVVVASGVSLHPIVHLLVVYI